LGMDARIRKREIPALPSSGDSMVGSALALARRTALARVGRRLRRRMRRTTEFNSHPMAWYGMMGEEVFRKHSLRAQGINSFLAKFVLQELEF
jgi:hypothetical protein